jgi:hypothetical protein
MKNKGGQEDVAAYMPLGRSLPMRPGPERNRAMEDSR